MSVLISSDFSDHHTDQATAHTVSVLGSNGFQRFLLQEMGRGTPAAAGLTCSQSDSQMYTAQV